MKGVVLTVIAIIMHLVNAGFHPPLNQNKDFYSGSLGSSCEYDDDCITIHAYCKSNRVCECKKKYQYDVNTDTCYPTQLGLRCNSNNDCLMENSKCVENKCQCYPGFVESNLESSTGCLPTARLQASCQDDTQCQAADVNSHCNISTKVCDCNLNFHAAWDTQQCTPNKRIRDTCDSHVQCASMPEQQDKVECRPDNDGRTKCFCRDGFSERNNKCTKETDGGAATLLLSVTTIFFSMAIHALQ